MNDAHAERKAQTRRLFNVVSPDYDAGPGCFAHFGTRLVERVGIEAGQRVLDVASGRGAVLFPAAERVGERGEVVGIDIAEEMARATNAEAERRGLAARVSTQDAEEIGFADESFDCVVCGFGVMFFPDQDRALGHMRRVLKRGGSLGVSTWRESQAEELSRVLADLGMGTGSPPGWITEPDALEQLLKRNGFDDVRVETDAHSFRYRDLDEYWQQARGTGLRGILDKLDAEGKQKVRAALAERAKSGPGGDGIHFSASALLAVARR